MSLSTFLALVASAVFLARLLPQPIRSLRTGRIEGVSGLASMNAAVADAAWFAYGVADHLPVIWVVALPAFVIGAGTAFVLRAGISRTDLAVVAAWSAIVAGTAMAGSTALNLVLAATVAVCCGPSVWSAYRSVAPEGISGLTWTIAVADATSWGLYGIVVHSVALELYAVVMGATAVAMLARVRATRARALALA